MIFFTATVTVRQVCPFVFLALHGKLFSLCAVLFYLNENSLMVLYWYRLVTALGADAYPGAYPLTIAFRRRRVPQRVSCLSNRYQLDKEATN